MEIFGCNNLISYKAKVATRLKISQICNLFHLVATLHLVTTLKQLMYLCNNYMAYTLQKLEISIFGYCNLLISLLSTLLKDSPHKQKHLVAIQPNVSYSAYIEVKVCSYNPSSNFNFYLWNGVLLFQQPLHNHHARLLQLCKVANTLHILPQPCDNLVTTLQSCSKVATTQLFPYGY